MSERLMARMMAPVARGLANLLARGTVALVQSGKMQGLQVKLLADEVRELEHVEPFGLTAHPMAGAECVAAFPAGDRSHGVVLVVSDRRCRPTDLAAGETALFNAHGVTIKLRADGTVEVVGARLHVAAEQEIDLVAGSKIRLDAPLVDVPRGLRFGGIDAETHRHDDVEPGSGTSGGPTA
ncbi:phage baseplate assembly protein V [Chitinibacteraceae bacterium HSL-7]